MAYQGPKTQQTYSRPADRWPEEQSTGILTKQKFVGLYFGTTWAIHHNLGSTNLIVDVWVDTSTPGLRYVSVDQPTSKDLVIKWLAPCRGKVTIYAITEVAGISTTLDQLTPATLWVLPHSLGTDNLIADVWVDNKKIDPQYITAYADRIELEFSTACVGKVCLLNADPTVDPDLRIRFSQIFDAPSTYPPSQHTHASKDIPLAQDADKLGGVAASDYLRITDIGSKVVPLDPATQRMDLKYLPSACPVRIYDTDGSIDADVLAVDNQSTPLFVEKIKTGLKKIGRLSMQPVVRFLQVLGNVKTTPTLGSRLNASTNWDLRLVAGDGLLCTVLDGNTIRLDAPSIVPKIFRRDTPLVNGASWTITDPVFTPPGQQLLTAYEYIESPGDGQAESNHISAQFALDTVFDSQGDTILQLNNDKLQTVIDVEDSHMIYEDKLISSYILPFLAKDLFYDSSLDAFLAVVDESTMYKFYIVDAQATPYPTTALYRGVNKSDVPGLFDIRGGTLYAVRATGTNEIEVVATSMTALPVVNWTVVATITGSAFPPTLTQPHIVRVDAGYLYFYNRSLNELTIYPLSTPSNAAAYTHYPPFPGLGFNLWPDGFASFTTSAAAGATMKTTEPLASPTTEFVPGQEANIGGALHLGLSTTKALGVNSNMSLVFSPTAYQQHIKTYKTGAQLVWLRSAYAIPFSATWSSVYDLDWEATDLSGFSDVKVAFSLTPSTDMPTTVYKWDGTTFRPFSIKNIGIEGQSLDIIKTIKLPGNTTLSYVLYFKKTDPLTTGFVQNNIKFTYKITNVHAPISFSKDGDNKTLQLIMPQGKCVITNNMGRDVKGLSIVVFNK